MGVRWLVDWRCYLRRRLSGADFDDVSRTVFRPKMPRLSRTTGTGGRSRSLFARQHSRARRGVPGEPDKSLLIEKVTSGEMPLACDPLPDSEIALLRDWIAAGAPDAPPAEVATAPLGHRRPSAATTAARP